MFHLAFEQEYHYTESECQCTVGINKQSYCHGLDLLSAVQRGFTETRISVDVIISCVLVFFFQTQRAENSILYQRIHSLIQCLVKSIEVYPLTSQGIGI